MKKKTDKVKVIDYVLIVLLSVCYFGAIYYLVTQQILRPQGSYGDYFSDIYYYMLEVDGMNETYPFPYQGLFQLVRVLKIVLGPNMAMASAIAFLSVLSPLITRYYIGKRILCSNHSVARIVITITSFLLMFVMAVWIPNVTGTIYMGKGSPNYFHNQTGMAAKPFIILSFFLMIEVYEGYKKKLEWKKFVALAVAVAASVYVKPIISTVYFPIFALYGIYDLIKEKFKYWKGTIAIVIAFLPSLGLLFYQYRIVFGQNEGIGISPGLVWHSYNTSIKWAVLLVMIFPLAVLIMNFRTLKSNLAWRFSWYGYFIGILEFYLLYEKGSRMQDGNFMWGYNLGLFFLFMMSLEVWLKDMIENKKKLKQIPIALAFVAHLISGIWYFYCVMNGGYFATI